jgi:diketogulonate reductase-like aldo/keto reductase
MTQSTLAWLLAKKPWIVPIPGTTELHRFEEDLGAANVDLTAEDLHAIESASSTIKVAGARYPQWVEQVPVLRSTWRFIPHGLMQLK